jgi:hypothetical protein
MEIRRGGARTILLGVADEDVVQNDVAANVETQDSLMGVENERSVNKVTSR